jgi:hypothetical protein
VGGDLSIGLAQPPEAAPAEGDFLAWAVRRVGVAEYLPQPFSLGRPVRVIRQADLGGFGGQVVQGDRPVFAPACLDGQDARVADLERAPLAPAEFRALATHANGMGRPGIQ